MERRRLKVIAGNWKMNQDLGGIRDFFMAFNQVKAQLRCQAWIAPQFVHIPILKELAFTLGNIAVGAQNCANKVSGALTGEVSPATLADLGVRFVILGHSERRTFFKEDDALLNQKLLLALAQDLEVVFCIGETLDENQAGRTQEVLARQVKEGLKAFPADKLGKLLIAYEPVWAIGTGKTATPEQAQEAHHFVRAQLVQLLGPDAQDVPILYGGSLNNDNAQGLLSMPDIDGGLVGGASLKGKDFVNLCLTASQFAH